MPLRVLICDDELMARKRLARLLAGLPDVEVVGECVDGAELPAAVRQHAPDVVMLDIHMPHLSGIDAFALLGESGPAVIFCTAHATHAVDAFALGACDYILKPVEAARLKKAIERAQGRRNPAVTAPVAVAATTTRLAVPTRRGVLLIDPNEITHAVLEEELVTIFTVSPDSPSVITDFSLSDLEDRLPVDRFIRVHRKAMVNLWCVVRLDPVDTGGYVAQFRGGQGVVVSRAAARELRRRLGLRDVAG